MNKELTDKLRKCAEYMDEDISLMAVFEDDYSGEFISQTQRPATLEDLKYHTSFDALMPLWSKLRRELEDNLTRENEKVTNEIIKKWQLVCTHNANDPSKAFEVVCEAVDLVTNQKVKQ
jgi:hypothetical protein